MTSPKEKQSKPNRDSELPPDRLNAIGVLTRREVEARLLAPLLDALGEEFGRERVIEIVKDTIVDIARRQGAELAKAKGGDDIKTFAESLENWKKDDAMQIEVLGQDGAHFDFNVTRCRYAEMYRALGIPELGAVLSCNRDWALIEGFNLEIELSRTQTLMEGAPYCNFRYTLKEDA